MSKPNKKNPYRELAKLLREVPEDHRLLISTTLRGSVGEIDCGCAFGVAYPNADTLDVGDLIMVYAYGSQDVVDNEGSPSVHAIEQHEASRAFYLWVRDLGGDMIFVQDVMSVNDGYYAGGNDSQLARKRYAYVLSYLDERAESFDAGPSFIGEAR